MWVSRQVGRYVGTSVGGQVGKSVGTWVGRQVGRQVGGWEGWSVGMWAGKYTSTDDHIRLDGMDASKNHTKWNLNFYYVEPENRFSGFLDGMDAYKNHTK